MGLIALTRGEIINHALDIAGRPDLLSQARLWLNLYLEEVYYNHDVYWVSKNASIAVSNGVSMPDDYRAMISAQVVQSNGTRTDIAIIQDPDKWQEIQRNYQSTNDGVPLYALADELNRSFQFLPSPSPGHSLDLRYYSVPSLPDHTDAGTDSQVPVWKLPAQVLVDKIKVLAFEYNDDDRFDRASAAQEKGFAQARFNDHDKRAGSNRLKMGKSFKKRF